MYALILLCQLPLPPALLPLPAVVHDEPAPAAHEAVEPAAATVAEQMLETSNAVRAASGLTPQVLDERLCAAAQEQADYLSRTGQFDHHVNGDPRSRAAKRGFRGIVRENLAGPFQSIANAFRGWCGSSGHYASIVSSDCDVAGFGYAPGVYVAVYGKETSSRPSIEPPAAAVQRQPQAIEHYAPAARMTNNGAAGASYCGPGGCGVAVPVRQYQPVRRGLFGRRR